MPRLKWSQELILERIRELRERGSDLTPSEVGARHGALVSAAERYFGNWPAAVRAAGIDYEQVRESGRRRRSARISKWSRERIVAEIRRLHQAGEDLSWAVMERKYQPLCAAAVKQCYFGSWRAAMEAAGLDYEQIKAAARQARRWRARWRKELTVAAPPPAQRSRRKSKAASPTAAAGWARELLREKAAEDERERGQDGRGG
jgi:hypothetical protein